MAEQKKYDKEYNIQGLWLQESKAGNKYLSGFNSETKRAYRVVKNKEGVSTLITSVGDEDGIRLGDMREIETKNGLLKVIGDVYKVSENPRYQEQIDAGKKAATHLLYILKDF